MKGVSPMKNLVRQYGWEICKDTSGHKGGKWKLLDKKNRRMATFDALGRVVGK